MSDFLNGDGAWNMQRLEEHFWPMDVQHIVKIKTSPRNRHDFIAWAPEKNGCFTVKSAYKLAMEEHDDRVVGGAYGGHPSGDRSLSNFIWRANVPLKMRVTAWKAAAGALANQCKAY